MLILTKKDIMFYLIMISIVTVSMVTPFYIEPEAKAVMNEIQDEDIVIIVDAGHGEPDGGAVSNDGIKESTLNLAIAQKLETLLLEENFTVIMTREDEKNIADNDKQSSIREMKVSDINNRIEIANSSNADFLISIHMNKFEQSKYKGWQTFYKQNSEDAKRLAESIQAGISQEITTPNNRTSLKIEGIKLVDKATIPVVIVECGFLSNPEEKVLLQREEYQEKLAQGICNGMLNYLNP